MVSFGVHAKPLALVLAIGLAFRLCVAFLAPVWAGPDEPSHYAFIKFIAENKRIPYQPEGLPPSLLDVTGQNPPLFHIIGAVFYLVSGSVYWLRLVSVLFGVVCVFLTFLVARELSSKPFVALGSAAFVSLLPTHVVLSATINNEATTYAFILLSVLFLVKSVKSGFGAKQMLFAVFFFGLAFATRFNAALLGAPFLFAVLLFFRNGLSFKRLVVFAPGAAIALTVLAGNFFAYGKLFPFRSMHPTAFDFGIVTYFIPRVLAGYWLQEYGVAFIPEYRVIIFGLLGTVSLVGFASAVRVFKCFFELSSGTRICLVVLSLAVASNVLLFVVQNLFYHEPDARLLYPTVSFVAMAMFYGFSRFKTLERFALAGLLFALMVFLDLLLVVNHNSVLPNVPWLLPESGLLN